MKTKVLVLGAGFGGLELTTLLSEACSDSVEVTLVDHREGFVFGFSKLDVMFGRLTADQVTHRYGNLVKPGVRFIAGAVRSIDAANKRVETSAGTFEADILVVALGADLHPELTPGLVEDGHEFYTSDGAFELRDILANFDGGNVVVGVTALPFKCPPAPSETALLMHDLLVDRGLRDSSTVSLVMPFGVPIPPSPAASKELLATFVERDIRWVPEQRVTGLDPQRHMALLSGDDELPYDLFLGVPVHQAPKVVQESGMTVDGWIPVDPYTLETSFPDVYAVGDVASVGTPKAGVFAEGQAAVVAARIIAEQTDAQATASYDGRGMCYLEFGHDLVATVDVTFEPGQRPTGAMQGPSAA
ncbi:MAG TPA: FAD/NAD(P)-binding oxidoreductase, partial [Actinomycetes bacterium]|nr:FAD/NAD(P)-binding oxidoreductase [Actinomycetes bacterium]